MKLPFDRRQSTAALASDRRQDNIDPKYVDAIQKADLHAQKLAAYQHFWRRSQRICRLIDRPFRATWPRLLYPIIPVLGEPDSEGFRK
jgi:hypothetical protein